MAEMRAEMARLLEANRRRIREESKQLVREIGAVKREKQARRHEYHSSDMSESVYKEIGRALRGDLQPQECPAIKDLDASLREVQQQLRRFQ